MILNDIKDGIVKALTDNFKDVPVYDEDVEQGTNEPCFFIDLINSNFKAGLGLHQFKASADFAIYYLPADKENAKTEINSIIGLLDIALLTINVDGVGILGYNQSLHIDTENEMLVYTVSYDAYLKKKEDFIYMETLESEVKVNG